jgi:WD40 repeat protein
VKVATNEDRGGQTRAVLAAFGRALGQEAHVLVRSPELSWQQLHNRLQWVENTSVGSMLAEERERRSGPGAQPWLRLDTPHRESEATVRVLEGHTDTVEVCAFSPDGQRIVSGGQDETLRVWDTVTGECLQVMKGHVVGGFSPDGRLVIFHEGRGTVRVREIATGREVHSLDGRNFAPCGFSPDGRLIVTAHTTIRGVATLRVWDASTGECLRLLGGDELGEFAVWLDGRRPVRIGHTDEVLDFVFSPNGRLIVSAGMDETLQVWEVATGRWLQVLAGHIGMVHACGFSPDGNVTVSGGQDKTLRLWHPGSGQCVRILEGHTGTVLDCGFSPDGRWIVSASEDRTVRVWDAVSGECLQVLAGHKDEVHACGFSLDGRLIVSAGMDETLRVWDVAATGEEPAVVHRGAVEACGFSPDGRLAASASGRTSGGGFESIWEDRTLGVWDAVSGECLRVLEGHTGPVLDCGFSPDGRLIVSAGGSKDGTLRVWDAAAGECMRVMEGHGRRGASACEFSPDGRLIASGGRDSTLRVWDSVSGECLRVLEGQTNGVVGCGFSPDGSRIVSAGRSKGGTLRVLDAVSGECLQVLEGHTGVVLDCGFSPDGRWIVSASSDKTVRLWDAVSGECVRVLEGHTGAVNGCAVSPDGAWVASASGDKTLRVSDATSGKAVAHLPLPSPPVSVGAHPWESQMVCGDQVGAVYRVAVVGLEYGPIIVTATDRAEGLAVRCPACQQDHPVTQGQLGTVFACPTPGCGLSLRINPFVLQGLAGAADDWSTV